MNNTNGGKKLQTSEGMSNNAVIVLFSILSLGGLGVCYMITAMAVRIWGCG